MQQIATTHIKANEIVSLARLVAHPENYRTHNEFQIKGLIASLTRFGQARSIVCQDGPEHLLLVAGHGVVEAARRMKWRELRADILPADWTPGQVKGYLIADNALADHTEDDTDQLSGLLQEQRDAGYDLLSMGYDDKALQEMINGLQEEEAEPDPGAEDVVETGPNKGQLLALLHVTLAEPIHPVARGEVWALDNHFLICAHVFRDWSLWTRYLKGENSLFLPFAGPLCALSQNADTHILVLVQPDPYIAGHVVDRYAEVHGQQSVWKAGAFNLVQSEEEDEDTDDSDSADDPDSEDRRGDL